MSTVPPHIPADLEAFRSRTLERTRARPLHVVVEQIKERIPYEVYHLTYRSLGDIPIRANLAVPIEAAPPMAAGDTTAQRRFPAIVTAPGYGGWEFGTVLAECQRGYVVLQCYPRSQGESGNHWRVENKAYHAWINHGRDNPEGFFYQGAYMDLVRGIDYLLTRPDVDPARIGLMGTSQGGMLVLGAAAVDARVRAVVSHLPCLCDFRNSPAYANDELSKDPIFLRTWNYFEPVHLAHRIRTPTLLSSGGRDNTCPAITIQNVFDQLPGIKSLVHYPDLTHTSCGDFYAMAWQWVQRYV